MGVGDFFMKHMVLLTLIFLTFGLCANQSDRLVMPSTEENNYPFWQPGLLSKDDYIFFGDLKDGQFFFAI